MGLGSINGCLRSYRSSYRVVAYNHGEFIDYDIEEALAMKKMPDEFLVSMSKKLSR